MKQYSILLFFLTLVVTILKDELLLPFNKLWMHFGLILNKIISPVVLGFIFFGLISPIAIVTKALGRDELRLKKKSSGSFWKIREIAKIEPRSFKNQF